MEKTLYKQQKQKNHKKMERKKEVFIAGLFLSVLLLQMLLVSADGGYFPPPGQQVSPGQQKAVIHYDSKTEIETLIVTSEFQGNAKDLAWIIPTPTKPEITKADDVIFEKLDQLTKPQRDTSSSFSNKYATDSVSIERGVYVYESKKVDYYDVNTLYATNSEDLIKWFEDNNYQYPKEQGYVLEQYIKKDWFFTAIKIAPEAISSGNVQSDIRKGTPTPVKMIFRTKDIVFPLKISSIDFTGQDNKPNEVYGRNNYYYPNHVPIHIFLIGEGKYKTPHNEFRTQYANWFEKQELQKALQDNEGKTLLQLKENPEKEYFVTRMFANIPRNELDSDVYFSYADNNEKINTGPDAGDVAFQIILGTLLIIVGFVLSPLGWILIAGILMVFFSKNSNVKIFGWIMQLFILAIVVLFTFIIAILGLFAVGSPDSLIFSFIASGMVLIITIIILILIQKKKNKSYKRKGKK